MEAVRMNQVRLFYLLQNVVLLEADVKQRTTPNFGWTTKKGNDYPRSILGPDLCNISNDYILRMEMPENTFSAGLTDDMCPLITLIT